MRLSIVAAVLVTGLAGLYAGSPPAHAKAKTHQDEVRGFQCRVEDSWEQVPPKPGTDDAHIAAVWKDPSPGYRRFSGDQPTFKIIWTIKPKGDAPPPEEQELPDWAKDLPEEQQEQLRSMLAGTKEDLDGEVNSFMQRNSHLFGPFVPVAERWDEVKKPKTIKTKSGQECEVLEINYHKKRPKDTDATWWLWIARTGWETETEIVELGFYGYVDVKFAKKFRKQYEATVKSFKLREFKEDKEPDLPDFVGDPNHPEEIKIAKFIKEKVIKGWTYKRTPNYLVVYDEDVNKKIVKRVTKEIEALRAQVYEVMFPPDQPVEAISIVRVCETREQYRAYGAPGGSAGYWSPYHEELVLYQDKNDKKDAIRVLYHEAFHQYIYYSVGEVSPHSWFNEGHGDFFSGHVYKSGKFKLDVFGWRTETARSGKSNWKKGILRKRVSGKKDDDTSDAEVGERLTLREWLTWRQPQYYGGNDWGIPGGVNYALGWSFIYFLRTTKNEDYQKILPRYFNTLKSFVTQDREAREKALEDGLGGEQPGEGEDGEPGNPGEPAGEPVGEGESPDGTDPEATKPGETTDVITRAQWHGESLREATQGLDLDKLEQDWLKHSW